jgi:hypothetical protein
VMVSAQPEALLNVLAPAMVVWLICSNEVQFGQVNQATIAGAKTFKSASGCALTITGGTETGHASGTYSHWNGYKVDYRLSSCVTNYIKSRFSSIGGNKWKSNAGNIYYLESNHWDVTYYNCGC